MAPQRPRNGVFFHLVQAGRTIPCIGRLFCLLGEGKIRVRTYERGVEGETLACGTGVTASAIISAELHQLKTPVPVQVQGGKQLEVGFEKKGAEFANVTLTGPADFVFEGRIELADKP